MGANNLNTTSSLVFPEFIALPVHLSSHKDVENKAPDTNNSCSTGYELIGQVAQNSQVPTDEMIGFVLDILKMEGRKPQDLTLEELKLALLDYISKLD